MSCHRPTAPYLPARTRQGADIAGQGLGSRSPLELLTHWTENILPELAEPSLDGDEDDTYAESCPLFQYTQSLRLVNRVPALWLLCSLPRWQPLGLA